MSTPSLRLVKLRPFDVHCHLVADDGRAGLDLRGDEARAAFAEAAALFEAVTRARPGTLRALSVDFRARRLLATVTVEGEAKPAVVRIDGAALEALLEANAPLWDHLSARYAARRPA